MLGPDLAPSQVPGEAPGGRQDELGQAARRGRRDRLGLKAALLAHHGSEQEEVLGIVADAFAQPLAVRKRKEELAQGGRDPILGNPLGARRKVQLGEFDGAVAGAG